MTLKLYNTLTRTKEEFKPLDPNNVRLYVCGPTVYDYAHIGNARPVIVFDVLFRLLRHLYGEAHVTYVRNITDVDDKINARAREEGVSIRELTERTAAQFHEDISALGVLRPTSEPRATEHIAEMIALIERLIARGHAYVAEGHVLFDVTSIAQYGRLSRRSLDEMIAGARVDVAPYKRGEMDFVLWKPSDAETPGWESPWGRGRPGWHIECSAMAWKHLGERFDIHGGGIDLIFPHHENEIAQTTCAFGSEVMADIWMHNGFLQVEGQKMSKSLGNFITIHELLNARMFGHRRWSGEVLRFAMLMTHYRQPIDFTVERLHEAENKLDGWYRAVWDDTVPTEPFEEVLGLLEDDLNTWEAVAALDFIGFHPQGRRKRADHMWWREEGAARFKASAQLLGLHQSNFGEWQAWRTSELSSDAKEDAETLVQQRTTARRNKNWKESDRIRDELAAMGIAIKDNKDGTTTWEVKR